MRLLESFVFHGLLNPAALLLLVGVLILFVFELVSHAPGAVSLSTGESLKRVSGGMRVTLRRLPAVLRVIALSLLIIALARPIRGLSVQKDSADIVDIMLCVDVSRSMRAADFVQQGQNTSRLDVTKQAVRDFIESRKNTPADRYGLDRLGLVLYAGYAWTQTPLTLDYDILSRDVERAQIEGGGGQQGKNGTAIGSAIGLAVNKLRKSEAKAKIIILLTDGRNNAGELDPITAAQLAKEFGVRVYTIAAGSSDEVLVPMENFWGTSVQAARLPIDEETLRSIADISGGKFYRATDVESLKEAYDEINKLETTKVELGDYYEYKDAFMPWAVAGALAMMASVFGRRLWFEPIP
ncbi:MAG: VWA domain-containing protein [Candidatus Hydrogenedentes bacterium]|nr:VWA domain-containing protein [Candidatus Hydrogenedentota bacterium]